MALERSFTTINAAVSLRFLQISSSQPAIMLTRGKIRLFKSILARSPALNQDGLFLEMDAKVTVLFRGPPSPDVTATFGGESTAVRVTPVSERCDLYMQTTQKT